MARFRTFCSLLALAGLAACSNGSGANGAATNGAAPGSVGAAPPAGAFAFAADPCDATVNAMLAMLHHDHAIQMTLPNPTGGAPRQGQTVQVGDKIYVESGGVWRVSPMVVQDEIQMTLDNRKTSQMTCKPAGADVVEGQPVVIYDAHIVNKGDTSDNRLWLSTATGLPLKLQVDVGDAGGATTQQIRYDNVTVPANVAARP